MAQHLNLISQDVIFLDVPFASVERDQVDPETFRRMLSLHPPRPADLLRQGGSRNFLQSLAHRLQVSRR